VLTNFRTFHFRADPKKFFTSGEKAIWRNLAAWCFKDNEWIDLPGPAEWWPESIDEIDATGFTFSDQTTGHEEAMKLVLSKETPNEELYQRLFPSHTDLRVMNDDSQTRMLLDAFFSL
jgi:hypothetical protein